MEIFSSFTFLHILIYLFALFEFGFPTDFEQWKKSCQKIVAEIAEGETIYTNNLFVPWEANVVLKSKLNELKKNADKFPISELRKKYTRRLGEPLKRVMDRRTSEKDAMSLIGALGKQFGTLVVEVETHFLENMRFLKNKERLQKKLDQIIEFMAKNDTFCDVEYFKMAKKELEATEKAMEIEHIVQNRIMDARLSILERELPTKKALFQNAQIGDPELVAFMPDFHSDLRQAGHINCYWGDKHTMMGYLQKTDRLFVMINDMVRPLKECAQVRLKQLLSRQTQDIIRINALLGLLLIEDKENWKDFEQILEEKIDKIKQFGANAMAIVETLDTPKMKDIRKTVNALSRAADQLKTERRNSSEVVDKINQLVQQLDYERIHFVDKEYSTQ